MSVCESFDCSNYEKRIKEFIKKIPKVELHAHLNGSFSNTTLSKLYDMSEEKFSNEEAAYLQTGSLSEFFEIFDFIYKVTATPEAIFTATKDVISDFYEDGVKYLEIRSTPREVPGRMTLSSYVESMISAINTIKEEKPDILVKLLLAINRKNPIRDAEEILRIAKIFKDSEDSIIVGLDFSGNPSIGDVDSFLPIFESAKRFNLKLAVHMAETTGTDSEVEKLLSIGPDRIGHGTFLHPDKGGTSSNFEAIVKSKIPLEICLSSNIICKTVPSYEQHHFPLWRNINHPCVLCTDDKGVFNTTLSEEYELARKHFNLTPDDLWQLSYESIKYSFATENEKQALQEQWLKVKDEMFSLLPRNSDKNQRFSNGMCNGVTE